MRYWTKDFADGALIGVGFTCMLWMVLLWSATLLGELRCVAP